MIEADRVPALGRPSFYCPWCGTLTSQQWFKLTADEHEKEAPPYMPREDMFEGDDMSEFSEEDRAGVHQELIEWRDKMRTGRPFFADSGGGRGTLVENLKASLCYTCNKLAIWVGEMLVFPPLRRGIAPAADMPDAIRADFEEARSIIDLSPRGAAALLRLALQKLCAHLGEPGKDLNTDIGSLVAKGLPLGIQRALDIVRVVGNESVHPGELDMKDDHDTAEHLLVLVNMIVEDRITKPKQLEALFSRLPQSKRDGIERRDAAARKGTPP